MNREYIIDECSEFTDEQFEFVLELCQQRTVKGNVVKTPKKSVKKKSNTRCPDTIDWVSVEHGDEYKRVKNSY